MKRNIALMYAIALLQGMVFYAPVATLCRQAHGLSIFQITLIESVSLALCILLEVPWGAAADRMGYKRTMVFCCTLYFASKIVFWQADGFGWFLAERLLFGLAALSCLALAGTRSAPLSVAWVLLLRVGNSLFQPLQLELQNRQITTEDRATALSVGAMVMDGVGVGANLAFGAAAELTLSAAFLLGAVLCGVGLLLFCLWGSYFSI